MPTPTDLLSLEHGHETPVSREQAFRHAVLLMGGLGNEASFAAAVALVQATNLPFTLVTPIGHITKVSDDDFTMLM